MKKYLLLVLLLAIFCFVGCSEDEATITSIIGKWSLIAEGDDEDNVQPRGILCHYNEYRHNGKMGQCISGDFKDEEVLGFVDEHGNITPHTVMYRYKIDKTLLYHYVLIDDSTQEDENDINTVVFNYSFINNHRELKLVVEKSNAPNINHVGKTYIYKRIK